MNKKVVYIHIGAGKTGTTSIQNMLGKSAQNLLDAGIMYHPTHPKKPNHHNLVSTPLDKLMWERSKLAHQQLKKEFEMSSASIMIISTEKMFGVPKIYMKELKKLYQNMDIKIIAYVRNQIDSIPSHFLQRQKDYETNYFFSIENAFEKYKDSWGGHPKKLIEGWMTIFKRENIIVRVYDRKLLYKEDVCKDFAKTLGIADYVDTNSRLEENISLVPELSRLVSVIDREFPDLSKKHFHFRQKNVIMPLLNISKRSKQDINCNNLFVRLQQLLVNYSINHFDCKQLPKPVVTQINRSKKLIREKIRVELVSEDLQIKILNYYKDINYRFSDIFLGDHEKEYFLKYYKKG